MKFRVVLTARAQVIDETITPSKFEEVGVSRGFFVTSEEIDIKLAPEAIMHVVEDEAQKLCMSLPGIIADDMEEFVSAVVDATLVPIVIMQIKSQDHG